MKNLTFLLLFFLYGNALVAQPSYKARCSELDKSKIETDFLADYQNPINHIYLLDGSTVDTISLYSFKQLFFDLKKCELVPGTLPEMAAFRNSINAVNGLFTIPLGLIHKRYTKIRQNALPGGHLDLVNDKFIETGAPADSMYAEGVAFAIAPLRLGNYLPVGSPLTFVLKDDLIFTNNAEDFISYEVDFGQGAGYQYFYPNQEVSVNFNSDGEKLLRFRLVTTTDTLYSHATMNLANMQQADTPTTLSLSDGDRTFHIPDAHMEFSTGPYSACGMSEGATTGRAYIRYADPENPALTNPIIFVEGLDLGTENCILNPGSSDEIPIRYGKFGWDVFTTGVISEYPEDETFRKLPELLDAFNEDGYDIILLDFEKGATFIQQNSDILKQLINRVNNEKVGCEELVIIGASMGGMIARYTLATMEQANENHQTRLYGSFDAPHQGANIPISLQEALDHLKESDPNAAAGIESLRMPAPRQLVIIQQDGNYCLRENFVAEMEAVGYPELCRKVSIVSGSDRGPNAPSSSANPGGKLLEFRVDAYIHYLLAHFNINMDFTALERKDYLGSQEVYNRDDDFTSANPFVWLYGNIIGTIFDKLLSHSADATPSDWGALDSAPGGTRNTISQELVPDIEEKTEILKNKLLLFAAVVADVDLTYEEVHSFTPSTSALDVDTEDLFFKIDGVIPKNESSPLTPFDAHYAQPENLAHVEVSDGIINWVRNIELPKSRVNLGSTLNETYNYGHIINKIPAVTIAANGILRVNDNGATGYLDESEAMKSYFTAYTRSGCESDITIQNGGQFILGSESAPYQYGIVHVTDGTTVTVEAGGTLEVRRRSDLILESGSHLELSGLLKATFGGKIFIKDGASLRVTNGGTLRMIHSSRVIVEEGGQLIIEDGANINLWDNSNHRARIEVAGELVINGQLSIGGTGHFKFNKGNQVTFGHNISEFAFRGNSQTHRFFLIGEDATLNFGEMPFVLTNGIIEYEPGSTILSEKAPYLTLLGLNLTGIEGGGTAITARGVDQINLRYANFSDLQFGLNSLGENNGTVYVQNCDFKMCRYGLFSNGHDRVDLYSSTFSGEGLDFGMATFLTGNQNVSMTSTDIVGYRGSAYQSDYDAAISLGSDQLITNLSMYGCLVQNNYIGITAAEGNNTYSDGNIFVRDGTTFQNNETAIYMVRGRHHEVNAGLVLLDCAKMIDNGVGVRGVDVLLQVDAEENCLECIGNPNTQIRPNTLITPYEFDGPANIFDICYQGLYAEEAQIEIPAKGNFWRTIPNLPHEPRGDMWRFRTNDICSGFVPDDVLDPENFLSAEPTGCPDETPGDGCPPGQICVYNPPNDKRVIVEIAGNTYNVHSQYAAAYQDFRNENITRSKERFMPIAGIPDEVRKNLSGVGRHYVDVARVMVNAFQDDKEERPDKIKGKGRSIENYTDTYGHLWLSGNKQNIEEDKTKAINFIVYPNPASDQIIIEADAGSYELKVYDVLGSLVHRAIIDRRTNLEVADWKKGLYTIELRSTDHLKNTMVQKLVIQ